MPVPTASSVSRILCRHVCRRSMVITGKMENASSDEITIPIAAPATAPARIAHFRWPVRT